jgi:cell division protein FtsN
VTPPAKTASATPAPAKEKAPPPAPPKTAAATPAPAAATGGSFVQIGAVSSQTLADEAWTKAAAIAPGLAAGKGKNVEKVDRDGKTLYRVQVTGFASKADAAAFCDKLKGVGKDCFAR